MTRQSGGFSLVEVSLALGVAAFALIAIFGLLPVGINSNQASVQQTVAANLATAVVADLRLASTGTNTLSPRYQVDVAQTQTSTLYIDESGSVVARPDARFRVDVSLTPPPAGRRSATTGHVTLSWPPLSESPSHSLSAFVALDRN